MADFATLNQGPYVAVMWDKAKVKGLCRLSDASPGIQLKIYPLQEAFESLWDSDAHFLPYLAYPAAGGPFDPSAPAYRLNKRNSMVVPQIREAGGDVLVHYCAVDWDTGRGRDHRGWTAEDWDAFRDALARCARGPSPLADLLSRAAFSYSTRRGWRWVFRFSRGVPLELAEPILRGVNKVFQDGGISVDCSETLFAWNTCARLPKVTRDGTPTTEDPFFLLEVADASITLDPDSIPPVGEANDEEVLEEARAASESSPVDPVFSFSSEERSFHDDVTSLLYKTNKKGLFVQTGFTIVMRQWASRRTFGPYLIDGSVAPIQGSRHDAFRDWSLAAAHYAATIPGTTAEHVYALFAKSAQQIDAQIRAEGKGGPLRSFRAEVWRLCRGAWNLARKLRIWEERKESAAVLKIQEKKVELSVQALTGQAALIAGVRAWYPALPEKPQDAMAWILPRLILRHHRDYYVMTRAGTYSKFPTAAEGVVPRIRQLGMDPYVELEKPNGKGLPRPIKREEWSKDHVTNVDRVDHEGEVRGGAHLRNPEASEGLRLIVPSFRRRTDLPPEFSPDVDLWIHALSGGMHDLLERHIASFLMFERGGTAAMSFNLAPGSGKKVLYQAFLECMEDDEHATGEDLVQRFNGKLARVAFLFMNEGLPEARHAHYHPSDTFRKILTGDYFQVEQKGVDAKNARGMLRCLMTANTWRLIEALGKDRDLDAYERDAIGQRLVHYPAGTAAAELLRSKGGHAWTRGWVEGDEPGAHKTPSKFTVAKHFFWLLEKYKDTPMDGRLIVEGDPNQPAVQRLRVRGGSTPTVVETILKMLDGVTPGVFGRGGGQRVHEGEDGTLHVTIGGVLDYWRANLSAGSTDRLTTHKISLSLKGLGILSGGERTTRLDGVPGKWYSVDVPLLAAEAHKYGWSSQKLDALLEKQRLRAPAPALPLNGNGHHPPPPGGPALPTSPLPAAAN